MLLPSALISYAVVLSLENCPGSGMLGKALGLRKELPPLAVESCLNSFITSWWWCIYFLFCPRLYVVKIFLCVIMKACQLLKLFPMGTLSFQEEMICCICPWPWHFLWMPSLTLVRKQAAVSPILKLLSLFALQGAKVRNSTPCKSALYTWCWKAWISWLKSLDRTIKNFTGLWRNRWVDKSFCCNSQHSNFRALFTGGSESTTQKLNTRKNAVCFAVAAWPPPCLKCCRVLWNNLTLYSELLKLWGMKNSSCHTFFYLYWISLLQM